MMYLQSVLSLRRLEQALKYEVGTQDSDTDELLTSLIVNFFYYSYNKYIYAATCMKIKMVQIDQCKHIADNL